MKLITKSDLESMPTITQGHFADLKIDTGTMRVWLSRMTKEDGETQPVQAERLIDGRWVDVTTSYHHANAIWLDGEYSGSCVEV